MDGRIVYPDGCRRGRTDCKAYALLESNTDPSEHTFICIGNNGRGSATVETDIYTLCDKTAFPDHVQFCDKRDLIHLLYVISAALVHIDLDELGEGNDDTKLTELGKSVLKKQQGL